MIKEHNKKTSLENQIFNLVEPQNKINSSNKFHSAMEIHTFHKQLIDYSRKTNELQDMFAPIYGSSFIVVETFSDSGEAIPRVDVKVGTFKNDENLILQNMIHNTLDIQTNLNVHYKLVDNKLIRESGNIAIPVYSKFRNMNDILHTSKNDALMTPQAGNVNIYLGKVAADYISHATRKEK